MTPHPVDVGAPVVAQRRLDDLDVEHVRGLLQGDVRGDGDDDLRGVDALSTLPRSRYTSIGLIRLSVPPKVTTPDTSSPG